MKAAVLGGRWLVVPLAAFLLGGLLIVPGSLPPSAGSPVTVIDEWEEEWAHIASVAWRYYSPGVGVDPTSGLHRATLGWSAFTDWDLGGYIISILAAETLGLVDEGGSWGSNDRIERILDFLETRQLNLDGIPYWAYDSSSGAPLSDQLSSPTDAGRLLVALHLLNLSRPGLYSRLDDIVHSVNNFAGLGRPGGLGDFYGYYSGLGFDAWGIDVNIEGYMAAAQQRGTVDVYGQSLPTTWITAEPFLHGLLEELDVGPIFEDYAFRLYKTQEARKDDLGLWTAWTEGAYDKDPWYLYEWVVREGAAWVVTDNGFNPVVVTPVVYLKAALGWHALFSSTYTNQLTEMLLPQLETSQGYREGVEETGRVVSTLSDKTNSLVLTAARYALHHHLNCDWEECAIDILSFDFAPRTISVRPLASVVWTNRDVVDHTVVSGTPGNPSGLFDSGSVPPGETFLFIFEAPGTYHYYDEEHWYMVGTVGVGGEPIPEFPILPLTLVALVAVLALTRLVLHGRIAPRSKSDAS